MYKPCRPYLLDQSAFDHVIVERMRCHIEQQKVLLLCGEDALFGQILGQSLAHVLQLIAQLEWIPCFTTQVFDPALH